MRASRRARCARRDHCSGAREVVQLEDRRLSERVRNHLRSPALLAEEPLEHVGGTCHAPMRDGQPQVSHVPPRSRRGSRRWRSGSRARGDRGSGGQVREGQLPSRRSIRDLADLNAHVRTWVLEEAGARIHGTTRERPVEQFAFAKPLIKPLPAIAPDPGTWCRLTLHRGHMVSPIRRSTMAHGTGLLLRDGGAGDVSPPASGRCQNQMRTPATNCVSRTLPSEARTRSAVLPNFRFHCTPA